MNQDLAKVVSGFFEANLSLADWGEPLLALREALDADTCAVMCHDVSDGTGRILHAAGIDPGWVKAYETQHGATDVWVKETAAFERPPAVIDSRELLSPQSLQQTGFYRFWLAPLRLRDHIFIVVERQGTVVRYISCGRAESRGPFTEEAFTVARRLAPLLLRAFAAGRNVQSLRRLNRMCSDALDAMPMGVAFLNIDGAIVSANSPARSMINDGDSFYVANGGLAYDRAGRRTRLSDLVAASPKPGAPSPGTEPIAHSISRRSGKRPVTFLLVAQPEHDVGLDVPVATLFAGDPEKATKFDPARISRLYGLSRAESRVAALLASGYRLDQISQIQGVAYETVRKHLKQVFSKTGTYRQAELVRILVSGPAGIGV